MYLACSKLSRKSLITLDLIFLSGVFNWDFHNCAVSSKVRLVDGWFVFCCETGWWVPTSGWTLIRRGATKGSFRSFPSPSLKSLPSEFLGDWMWDLIWPIMWGSKGDWATSKMIRIQNWHGHEIQLLRVSFCDTEPCGCIHWASNCSTSIEMIYQHFWDSNMVCNLSYWEVGRLGFQYFLHNYTFSEIYRSMLYEKSW